MRAKVTQAFDGVEDGQVYGRRIEVDEEITGDLAVAAVGAGWAVEVAESAQKAPESTEIAPIVQKNDEKPQESAEISTETAGNVQETADSTVKDEASEGVNQVEIPADWRALRSKDLKELAGKIAGAPVADSSEAKKVIEAELARRSA